MICNRCVYVRPMLCLIIAVAAQTAQAQLKIVTYNTTGVHPQLSTVLEGMGRESVNGVAKPIDVLLLQEQDSVSGNTQTILNMLNSLTYDAVNGPVTYARGTVNGATTGAGRQTMIYRQQTVQLIAETPVGSTSFTGAARVPMRYQLRPVGYDSTSDFYIYNSHYKASQGTDSGASASNETRRNVEATTIRADSNALGQGARVIYVGDFNIYNSSEPMWSTLTFSPPDPNDPSSTGYGQAFDPINRVGSWNNNSAFKDVHTQSPVTSSSEHFSGQVGGGMDDRFDWQMVTDELRHNEGMAYIAGSYQAFGNNGTTFNNDIDSPSNTALNEQNWDAPVGPYPAGYTASVRTALAFASDHIPVLAQYQVPAKMGTSVASLPTQVVVGASLAAQANVRNTAGDNPTNPLLPNPLVMSSIGADELDYRIQGSGAAGGTPVFGSALALASANSHNVALDTSTAGPKTAALTIDAVSSPTDLTNPQVPAGHQVYNVGYSVLDHANASFSSSSDQNAITIDFGSIAAGSGDQHAAFSINNLVATPGFTAPLDLLSIGEGGDSGILNINLATIDNLAAGAENQYLASLDTSSPGNYSASFQLSFSDDTNLLGATGGQLLTLNLLAQVTSASNVSGDLDDNGVVDSHDIDILWNVIRPEVAGSDDPGSNDNEDLNNDGFVNEDDVDYLLKSLLTAGSNRQYGDADLDGGVGGLDYTAWRDRAGTGWTNGDFDGDGGVGGLDYTLWRNRPTAFPDEIGQHGGAPLTVPEPATWLPMCLALPALLMARRRRVRVQQIPVGKGFWAAIVLLLVAWRTAVAKDICLAFWNVENLFDTTDDPTVLGDEEFTPQGPKQWTEARFQTKLENLSHVLRKMNDERGPDVFGLCEIENRAVLEKLIATLDIPSRKYRIVQQDSPSERGIDCALIYDANVLSLADARFHLVDADHTRDIVEAKLQCAGSALYVFVNHWPSRRHPEDQRITAADTLRRRMDELCAEDPACDFVAIGDFNDTPSDPSIRELVKTVGPAGESSREAAYNTSAELPAGTYVYDNRWELLDQIIVSPGMRDGKGFRWKPGSTQIVKFDFQMFQPARAGELARPSRSYSSNNFHADGCSDHLPVCCTLQVDASDNGAPAPVVSKK